MQQQWALFGGQLGCCTTCRNRSWTDRAIWWKAHARVIPKWPSPQQRKHPAWIKNWEGWSLLSASLSFPMHHSVKLTLWWQTHCCNLYPTSKCSRLLCPKSWHHNRRFREREKSSAADFRKLLKFFSILKENLLETKPGYCCMLFWKILKLKVPSACGMNLTDIMFAMSLRC